MTATKKAQALATLVAGEPLTTPKAIQDQHNWRLAATVHNLRAEGWVIQTERGPHGAALYYLKRPAPGAMVQLDLFELPGGAP
jgi:hypothetical protein